MSQPDAYRDKVDRDHLEQASKLVQLQVEAAAKILNGQPPLGDPVAEAMRAASVLHAINATYVAIRQRFDT